MFVAKDAPSWRGFNFACRLCTHCPLPVSRMHMNMMAAFAEAGADRLQPRDIVFPSAALADPGQSAALPVDLLVWSLQPSGKPQPEHCARVTLWPDVRRSATT